MIQLSTAPAGGDAESREAQAQAVEATMQASAEAGRVDPEQVAAEVLRLLVRDAERAQERNGDRIARRR